jgi:hypothetical protein
MLKRFFLCFDPGIMVTAVITASKNLKKVHITDRTDTVYRCHATGSASASATTSGIASGSGIAKDNSHLHSA